MTLVRLSPIDTEHLPYIQQFASEPEISKTSNMPYPYPADGAWSWYTGVLERTKRNESRVFAVLDAEFMGVCAINAISQQSSTCEVDYWVVRSAWGKGVCTEAVRQALLYCKHVLGIHAVYSACLTRNPASGRVLVKNGFEVLGQFVNDGKFGSRHLETMIRFRKVLSEVAVETADPKGIILDSAASLGIFSKG